MPGACAAGLTIAPSQSCSTAAHAKATILPRLCAAGGPKRMQNGKIAKISHNESCHTAAHASAPRLPAALPEQPLTRSPFPKPECPPARRFCGKRLSRSRLPSRKPLPSAKKAVSKVTLDTAAGICCPPRMLPHQHFLCFLGRYGFFTAIGSPCAAIKKQIKTTGIASKMTESQPACLKSCPSSALLTGPEK